MLSINSFGIIGGDRRQLYCARSVADDGYNVYIYGFETLDSTMNLPSTTLEELSGQCDAFILPLPATKDGKTLNAPFAKKTTPLDDTLWKVLDSKPLFVGMKNRLPYENQQVYDYSTREEFAVENAVPTAEGAIETAMREYNGTVHSSKCLVVGYGRIGRVLSLMLRGLGAEVTVSARKWRDLAFIRSAGMNAVQTDHLGSGYDIIFNTVPTMIFDAHTLAKSAANALIIDLASLPGGVDIEAAKRLDIQTVQALSLPGKVAPRTSGIIIKNAVYNIIKEELL